jgi:hypothetical protein
VSELIDARDERRNDEPDIEELICLVGRTRPVTVISVMVITSFARPDALRAPLIKRYTPLLMSGSAQREVIH